MLADLCWLLEVPSKRSPLCSDRGESLAAAAAACCFQCLGGHCDCSAKAQQWHRAKVPWHSIEIVSSVEVANHLYNSRVYKHNFTTYCKTYAFYARMLYCNVHGFVYWSILFSRGWHENACRVWHGMQNMVSCFPVAAVTHIHASFFGIWLQFIWQRVQQHLSKRQCFSQNWNQKIETVEQTLTFAKLFSIWGTDAMTFVLCNLND